MINAGNCAGNKNSKDVEGVKKKKDAGVNEPMKTLAADVEWCKTLYFKSSDRKFTFTKKAHDFSWTFLFYNIILFL